MKKNFYEGKKFCRYVTRTHVKPKNIDENYVTNIDMSDGNNAKNITWTNNFARVFNI